MTDRQDRLHELCVQVRSQNDLEQVLIGITEINDILGSIVSEVDWTMRSVSLRMANLRQYLCDPTPRTLPPGI
jgi:hypothetical protein